MLPYIVENPTLGSYAPTAIAKAGELAQLQNNRHVAIITGRELLSTLDAYIKDWKGRGGDQIRKEFEAALRA